MDIKDLKIIKIVESEAILNNEIYFPDTIITFHNDTSKFKIGDGKTRFNDLIPIGGNQILPLIQTALDAKLTATLTDFNAKLTANKVVSQPASAATTLAELVTSFNNLIAALKTAGVMLT